MGFVCSGSSDYLVGAPFSFVGALDAVGAWPPMRESHVEMDGAFALYEAWTMLQSGDCDTALVYSLRPIVPGQLDRVLALQLDPYYMAPIWPDPIALAALQARELLDSGKATEAGFRGGRRSETVRPRRGQCRRSRVVEGRESVADDARGGLHRVPAPPARRTADHRRCGRSRACGRRPGPGAVYAGRRGSRDSTTASRPTHSEPGT